MDENVIQLQRVANSVGRTLYFMAVITVGSSLQLLASALRSPGETNVMTVIGVTLTGLAVPMMLVSCGMTLRRVGRRISVP